MSSQTAQSEPRLLLTAVQELDRLARHFRRRLRDVAVQLSPQAGLSSPIGPQAILEAVPLVCRELLSAAGGNLTDARGPDGPKEEAA